MEISTDAINEQGVIDPRYTCDFDNSSPELRWTDPPEGTASLALIVEDPDAPQGLFTHWVVFDIPTSIRHLPAGIPAQDALPNGIRQGANSFGKLGYAGPCPPAGDSPHRYFFRIYALKSRLEIPHRATRDQLFTAIQPSIIATAEIMGRYRRAIQRAG